MNKIAVLGLGAMGSRIAKNLLRAGYEVTVFNRSPHKATALIALGARVADSPREAASASDIALSVVTDDAASRFVWLDHKDGAVRALRDGKTAVEMSTLTPSWVRELAVAVQASGGRFIDAPVVGSRPQADAGQLVVLAGGDGPTIETVGHVFSAIAAIVHHVGATGSGAAAKLAANFLFATQVAAVAEMLVVAKRFGIDDATLATVLGALPVTSPAALGALKLMQSGSYDPLFPIDLVVKDLGYHAALAKDVATKVPLTQAVRAVFASAAGAGFGGDNIHGVVRAYT